MIGKIAATAFLTALISLAIAFPTAVYHTSEPVSGVGGTRYWSLSLSPGNGVSPGTTAVLHKQENPGAAYYRPGQTSPEATYDITANPVGYGFSTDFDLPGNIPAGTWEFSVTTSNSRTENGPGRVGANVFSYCSGANSRLFYAESPNNSAGSSGQYSQVFYANEPVLTVAGCRLKVEYWFVLGSVAEDNSNSLLGVNSPSFKIVFPTPEGGLSTTTTTVPPNASTTTTVLPNASTTTTTIVLPNTTTSLPANATCVAGTKAQCFLPGASCTEGELTCLPNGSFGPCVRKTLAVRETCNGVDEDCDGSVDEDVLEACGSNLTLGECRKGIRACSGGKWGECVGAVMPSEETCDFKDNDCDGSVDEGSVCRTAGSSPKCVENWTCSSWSPCQANSTVSSRTCADSSNCSTEKYRPALERQCAQAQKEGSEQKMPSEKPYGAVPLAGAFSLAGIISVVAAVFLKAPVSKGPEGGGLK